ncbi:putative RNA polymerase sigma factor RpoE [Mycoplasma suis KI3806]|uniref:RNA polymerase sigma factor RpoE n=2 Tax=Mycoplasma suis TaxID=57372 RepID=F0V294_MYCS3|nr:putative RNA polymerase sigma factor RpoE [Mycoplasma suis KI3806]
MKRESMSETSQATLENIKKFQLNKDQEAFNFLLSKYFPATCKYASKFLSSNVYSNLVSWSFQEVESYVFLAFWKAINNYKSESESSLSFKNYLYQLVKFETLHELKKNFSWQFISKAHQRWCKEDENNTTKDSSDVFNDLSFRDKVQIIKKFLEEKNETYALIWELKASGIKSSEVCKKLNVSSSELKSRWQYIKKLVLDKYPSLHEIA